MDPKLEWSCSSNMKHLYFFSVLIFLGTKLKTLLHSQQYSIRRKSYKNQINSKGVFYLVQENNKEQDKTVEHIPKQIKKIKRSCGWMLISKKG